LPQFVVGLVVASGNATGEMPAQIGGHSPQVIMEDYVVPKGGSLAVSWGGDTDLRKGWVAGHLLLHRASNEMTITQYNLYWRLAAGGRGPRVGSIPAIGYTAPHCLKTTCPLINVTRIPGGGYHFDRGSYRSHESAMIKVSGPGWVTITRFDTERYYDILTVASKRISGQPSLPMTVQLPEGLTTITWFSDYSVTATGWTFDLFQSRGDSTAEFQLNATRVVGPGLEVVAAYGNTELPEGVFGGVTDYHSNMPPSPAFAPEAIVFTDQDNATGVIAGAAEVKPVLGAATEGRVTYYKLELANVIGEPVGDLGRVDANGDDPLHFLIPPTLLPAGVVQLLARAGNHVGLGAGGSLFRFVDAPAVAHIPQKLEKLVQGSEATEGSGSSSGVGVLEPWLPRASITEEQRVVWPPTSAAEHATGKASSPQSCLLGAITVPTLDAHALAAKSHLREAIAAAVASRLPHATKVSVEIVGITAEAGQMASEISPAATVKFQVALLEGAPAKALDRIEARLILLSLGGSDAARFNKELLERLAGAGANLPADTHVQVAEPWQLPPRKLERSLAVGPA